MGISVFLSYSGFNYFLEIRWTRHSYVASHVTLEWNGFFGEKIGS